MDMNNTEQCPGLTILQHGIKVHERYRDLLRYIKGRPTKYQWMLPAWFSQLKIPKLQHFATMRKYQIYHDCGKCYGRIEKDGKIHFPKHEEISYHVAKKLKFSDTVCELIRLDMVCHRTDGFADHLENPLLPSLLLTALAEVYANSEMFGGCETDSFKIKHKRILNRIKMTMS